MYNKFIHNFEDFTFEIILDGIITKTHQDYFENNIFEQMLNSYSVYVSENKWPITMTLNSLLITLTLKTQIIYIY